MSGCTSCGNKRGCDERKHDMFAAIDDALARLYPGRRWGQLDAQQASAGVSADARMAIARALPGRVGAPVFPRAGEPGDYSDVIDVLCVGRQPCLVELREGAVSADEIVGESAAAAADGAVIADEVYLRVALSGLAPFAAVQEVRMHLVHDADGFVLVERPRTGVFESVLLDRYRRVVAVLAEHGVRNLDFGDLTLPPEGFVGDDYTVLYGGAPSLANYLFFAFPVASENSLFLPAAYVQENAGRAWENSAL